MYLTSSVPLDARASDARHYRCDDRVSPKATPWLLQAVAPSSRVHTGETIAHSISRELSLRRHSVVRFRATRCGSGSGWECLRSSRREHVEAEVMHPILD